MDSSRQSDSLRLEALAGYGIAGTAPEPAYDDLATLARQICGTSQAFVTFVESDRVWFKAALGVETRAVPREASICSLLIEERKPLNIPDTLADPRTRKIAGVTEGGLRFYAGVPLMSPGGHVLGSLCVAETFPREISAAQMESLILLGRQVVAQLELRRQTVELRGTEWLARSVLELSEGAAWVVDVARRTVTGDPRLALWFNVPDELCLGGAPIATYLAAIHEEDRASVAAAVVHSAETGAAYDVEFRARGADGALRWFHSRGRPERDPAGAFARMPGLVLDTTARRAADATRAEDAARLRIATEAAQLGIFVWHVAEDRVSWENEQVYRQFGRTPEDGPINAADFAEKIVHPEDRPAFELAMNRAISSDAPFFFQGRFFRKDGALRWVEFNGQITRDAAGTPVSMLGTTADITARKEAEAELRHAHDTFLSLVENAPFGVFLVDAEFRVAQVSRGAQKVFAGVQPLLDRDFAEVLRIVWPEPFATEALGRYRHTLETGEPFISTHTEEQRADIGEVESYDWRLERIDMPEGGQGVVCYFYETTELRRTERALRASDARFRAAVKAVDSLLWTNNSRGEMEGEQPGWAEFTGQTREEYQGHGWAHAVHPEDAQPTIDAWNEAVKERRMFQFEHRVRRHDGEWRLFAIRAVPVLDAAGAIREWVGVHTDITEMRAAEVSLRESETLFRQIADVAPAMTWIVDTQMSCTFLSRSWYEYTGMPPGSGLGIGWVDTVHPDDRDGAARAFFAANDKREAIFFDYRVRRADGEYRWAIDAARPRFGPSGEYLGLVGNVFDIHERKMGEDALRVAKERAESASRAKDNFLAALSHELRTPLTPVLMSAAALREDESLPAHAREDLAMIERNITLEARLIDDLLDLTRIARGKLTLRPAPCDAHSLLSLAAEVVRDEAREKQIAFEWELAAKRSHLIGDPTRLQQVFWNLLRNAVKFTPDGGTIRVRSTDAAARDEDGRLCVEVSDTGIGFAPTQAERLFEPFEQGGREGDHRFGGLGLGLAIARAIVQLHDGEIRAKSEGEGLGATFIVELPGAIPPTSTSAIVPDPGEPPAHAQSEPALRLLVVEDHAPTLAVLSRLLTRAGHTVVTAETVAAARAAADAQKFDAVVSDLGLPDGTGLELMAHLRASHGLRGVVLSGYGTEEDLRRSRDAGFVGHLVKPVDFTQLRHVLREILSTQA